MQQYFIETEITDWIPFNSEQSHHIKNVMRMKEGSIVKVVDSSEKAALVSITYENKEVIGKLKEMCSVSTENKVKMILGMSLIKKEKWDYCIQKACECGAYEIQPFISSRSVVKISDEKNEKKLVRWNKIASEACEQSKRNHCCEVKTVCDYKEILNTKADLKLIAYENADRIASNIATVLTNHPHIQSVLMLVGPEGGFSEEEVSLALDKEFICVSLGSRILRAETAAITSLNMIDYHYELLGEAYGKITKN